MTVGAGPRGPAPVASRPGRGPALTVALVVALAVALVAAACGRPSPSPTEADTEAESAASSDPELVAARSRARVIAVDSCGAADPTRGSGIALADDLVLTAAHLVASGGEVAIEDADDTAGADPRPARVVAYDPRRDLALVAPTTPFAGVPPPPARATLGVDGSGTIVAGARSGDVAATVLDVTTIEIDDVRLTSRSTRRGYLVEAATGPGDSGAGLYDGDGLLVGLLFAVSTDDERRSWVTAASEIDAFLVDDTTRGTFACDPDRSRITGTG